MERFRSVGMLFLFVATLIAASRITEAAGCRFTPGGPCARDPGVFVVELLPVSADSGGHLKEASSSRNPVVDELCSPAAQEHMSDGDKEDINNLCNALKRHANENQPLNTPPAPTPETDNQESPGPETSDDEGHPEGEQDVDSTTPKDMIILITSVVVGCIVVTACLACMFSKLDSAIESPYHVPHEKARMQAWGELNGAGRGATSSRVEGRAKHGENSVSVSWAEVIGCSQGQPPIVHKNLTPGSNSIRVLDLPLA